jgi:succinate dehydrogenase / fumarate reductase cytochrome b subunit
MTTSATVAIYGTHIGKKIAMALSGGLLFGFLCVHMVGNLQLFVGPEKLNQYSATLHSMPALLWLARLGLLGSALVHLASAFLLWLANRRARPIRYARVERVAAGYAARTMIMTGPLVLLYVAYHLAHFTFGFTRGLGYTHDASNVYANMVASFQLWPVALAYGVANVGLGVHLYHGAWSLLQTLGVSHPRYDGWLRSLAVAVGLVVMTGFLAVPIGVQLDVHGIVPLLP